MNPEMPKTGRWIQIILIFIITIISAFQGVPCEAASISRTPRTTPTDTDHDGIPDRWEALYPALLTIGGHDAGADPDNDGLSNLAEYQRGTDPGKSDTDNDGLSDGDEVNIHHTDPAMADTDCGGRSDGFEVSTRGNPLSPDDDGDTALSVFSIDLVRGMNLISLPISPQDPSIKAVLSPIAGKYTTVWSYRNGDWKVYNPDKSIFNELFELHPGKGYWIQMRADAKLTVTGARAPAAIDIRAGWNLVGYNSLGAQQIENGSDMAPCILSIWSYRDDGWTIFDVINPLFSELSRLTPGTGYWVKASNDCTWRFE